MPTTSKLLMTARKEHPIHPGEVLREEFLHPLGLNAHPLAQTLQVPAPRINDVVRKRRAVVKMGFMRLG